MSDWLLKQTQRGDLESLLRRLLIQRQRVFRAVARSKTRPESRNPYIHHDIDYYLIIARRLYRLVQEASQKDSRIANIKGKKEYRDLYKKIKIRDHSEHPPKDLNKFPSVAPGSAIKSIHNVFFNKQSVLIHSGQETWDMNSDHARFIALIKETIKALLFSLSKTRLDQRFYKSKGYVSKAGKPEGKPHYSGGERV